MRIDPAPGELARIGRAIEARTGDILRGRAGASCEPAHRGAGHDPSTHAWHSDSGDGLDVWCAIGSNDARALLEIALAGPPAEKPTALERGILRETVERLLGACGRVWEERAPADVPARTGWTCAVVVTAKLGASARLSLYAPALVEPPAPRPVFADLRAVPISVVAALPPVRMRVEAVCGWKRGSLVALGCGPDGPVSLFAGARQVASGRLGTLGSCRALKICPSPPTNAR